MKTDSKYTTYTTLTHIELSQDQTRTFCHWLTLVGSILFACISSQAKILQDEQGNYVIATKEDFQDLMTNEVYWSNPYSFIQIADIDLEDMVLTPIGSAAKPFAGIYEGNGYTLKNAVIYWNTSKPALYGIFGCVCGSTTSTEYASIRNLNIVNVKLTRQKENAVESMTEDDIKLGILAGRLGELVKINDISIRNCKITDNNLPVLAKAIMAGGLAGDVSKNDNGHTMEASELTIRNIYCDVDIDLRKTVRYNNDQPQFFVGGILGRQRNPTLLSQLPDNTIYTGTIWAPRASISPSVANIRGGFSNNYTYLVRTYAGEMNSSQIRNLIGDQSAFDLFQSTRLYYDYRIYNSTRSAVEEITDTYPSANPPDGKYLYGTRTLAPNANKNGSGYTSGWSKDSDDYWPSVQGVNWGSFVDPTSLEADRTRIMDMLLQGRQETTTCHWEWDLTENACKLVNDNFLNFVKVYIEYDVDNNLYQAKFCYKDAQIPLPGTLDGTIQWYSATSIQDDDWTAISGANSLTIPANKSLFFRVEVTIDGVTLTSDYIAPFRIIYVYNPESNRMFNEAFSDQVPKFNKDNDPFYAGAGNDDNDGLRPETAVLTMAEAYKKLDEFGSVKTNSIVVMGYYLDNDYLSEADPSYLRYNKPVTITGTDNAGITNGKIGMEFTGNKFLYFQSPIRLDNIHIFRHWTNTLTTLFFICNYFDFTVDENVFCVNFGPVSTNMGLPADITTLPDITIVGGTQDCDKDPYAQPIRYANDIYPDRSGSFTEPDRTTVTLRSGVFARMICCSRNDGSTAHPNSHNITGSHTIPNRIRLNVNIKNDIDHREGSGREATKYGLKLDKDDWDKYIYASADFSHNLGLISGGQTDGTAYGDVVMNIYAGHIARVITSNISYGRTAGEDFPSDSFYGRAILNIYGNYEINEIDGQEVVTSETTLNEVFGGLLGRISTTANSTVCKPYFYGKSVINMYGGYIGSYTGSLASKNKQLEKLQKTIPNLYGVGSGGVTGLGYDDEHTSDLAIPYIDDHGELTYGDYWQAKGNMPTMTMLDGEVINLEVAKCEVNLYSGIILGSVYGGGYGFSDNIPSSGKKYGYAPSDLGVLYGDSKVTMYRHPDFQPAVVMGNIYGSGAGSNEFAEWYKRDFPGEPNKFLKVACQYGNTEVIISDGTVGDAKNATGGDVYAGSQGIRKKEYENVAALYGSTNLIINGGTIYGNIYGGSELANINSHAAIANSGNTHVTINGGTIGNNIFGGSKGIDRLMDKTGKETEDSKAIIFGSTNVTINGGDFLGNPFININQVVNYDANGKPDINIVDNRDKYRTFNIYGGGYMNCDIHGDANLNVYSSLLRYKESFVDSLQNPNAMPDPTIEDETTFHKHYMDITYRNFCVYGGGFGEKTNIFKDTHVYVTIPRDRPNVSLPHGYTLQRFLDHQSFFDVAGGGYSGDVGYWATGAPSVEFGIEEGTIVKNLDLADFEAKVRQKYPSYSDDKVYTEVVKLFDHYVGGQCNVTIDDYTFTRKIIGGGFYGSCRTTNTHIRCGSLRQIYGGSLLGYVYDRAYLQFGNRIEDFARWNPNLDDGKGGKGGYVYSETDEYEPFRGDFENLRDNYPEVFAQASAFAKELNDNIYITENIYGGNDVKGIIGTKFWEAPESTPENPIYGVDETDGAPLYCTDIDMSEEKGIVFNIYGGTFMGDVYSAGNGHYRGYFVPDWVRYDDGPARMYRTVISSLDPDSISRAYRSRPMVGSVNVNLRGNSENDFITIRGNFFGGGRECTIGEFNTILPLEDPRRLVAGGHLHVNIGGYTHIEGNMYLGAEGKLYSQQQCLPKDSNIDLQRFDGSTTRELARLGDAAYDHWYYDMDKECYLPGYPAPGKVDGNFGMTGEHMLSSYMQNVQVQGDVELTFYRFLYERNTDGTYKYRELADGSLNRIRRHWEPGEIAINGLDQQRYDAQDIVMNSFFLGGLSGSMTNNNVMQYTYPATATTPEEKEKWGCIYRITLPAGVTVQDKVVMGSENATIEVYPYNSDYTDIVKEDANGNPVAPIYTYEGGMITQHTFTYDLIAYNDRYNKTEHYVPDDFYTADPAKYDNIRIGDTYNLKDGQGTIYRYYYTDSKTEPSDPNRKIKYVNDKVRGNGRYSLAMIDDVDPLGNAIRKAYIGPRDHRTKSYEDANDNDLAVVSKLTLACKFSQLADTKAPDPEDHHYHYGGNVYGGCYNSGIVIGDVVLNLGSNLLGQHLNEEMEESFNDFSSLKYNLGRVFGGGFGRNTRVEGDTYVNLLHNFKGMNVFGGGMMGDVTGSAHVTYIGTEDQSYIFGSIYGGGLQGYVGTKEDLEKGITGTEQATTVRLFSGNVEQVYGGSCMGNLYGRAFVEVCDKVTNELDHLDYKRLGFDDLGSSRLIVGKVFGGNDIAGNINPPTSIPYTLDYDPIPGTPWEEISEEDVYRRFAQFSTGVYVHEVRDEEHKTSPGSSNGFNGFPLIGDLYGGSNGNYGVQASDRDKYESGFVTMALGWGCDTLVVDIKGLEVPHIDKSHLFIRGGSIINAYGGGDMSDIQGVNKITIDYPNQELNTKARAGFETNQELQRVWNVLHFSSDQQQDEVTSTDAQGRPIFKYQICRLFGGNNNSDMAIQPTWVLNSGNIGSLYSGGNFGKMTFYQAAKEAVAADPTANPPIASQEAVQEKGLTLTVNSYDLNIDNVYGGGRLGDIDPNIPSGVTPGEDFYGTTLNIERGIINHVYGGNDVSGHVSYGTNVNLYGAISGDVYCAGNGNYLYKYDRYGKMYNYDDYFDPTGTTLDTSNLKIREDFAFRTDQYTGARYFMLPAKTDYGLEKGVDYEASDAEVIMAINSYRPHVERSYLFINGRNEENKVWVRGNVYCGGNSAAVTRDPSKPEYEVKFEIGSNVILNGVFLGSNGYSLAQGDMIIATEKLNADSEGNDLNMVGVNDLSAERVHNPIDASAITLRDELYPNILDLYMRAVETTELPKNFDFDPTITNAYIGEFCVGGNRGSMMTNKCIDLTFPASLTIFDRLIGGCKDADVTYNGVTHNGGLNMPLDPTQIASGNKAKVDLKIKSQFRPLSLLFPDYDSTPPISIRNVIVGSDRKPWSSGDKFYLDKQCNVYGGCFESGTTVGDINITLYSDMLNYECSDDTQEDYIDKQAVINGIVDARSWRSFTVVGAGYGAKTEVYGDINITMLPEKIQNSDGTTTVTHPSAASIFGGSQEGLVVGNTKVEIRDGKILANVYGASEAAKMYGSTSVIVGYPKYYKALKTGNYRLNRTDYMSEASRSDLKDEFDEVVVPKTVAYLEGDLVPDNVYKIINGRVKNARINDVLGLSYFRQGKNVEDKYVDKIVYTNDGSADDPDEDLPTRNAEDTPKNYYVGDLFAPIVSSVIDPSTNKPIADHIVPQDYGVSWDDITIWIGDQSSNLDPDAAYYGQGNIYGGGYVPNTSNRTLLGQPTVMRYTKDYNRGYVREFKNETQEKQDAVIALYGGNTAVFIWDDERNGQINPSTGEYLYPESAIKDHVHIGSGYFNEVSLTPGASAKGYFEKIVKDVPDGSGGTKQEAAYIYLTTGKVQQTDDKGNKKVYYEKVADGGVYGDGRKVFAQAFRSIDLAYYGYAEHTPQQPKLLNTIQRADLVTVTDCCMELVGASDFTVNDYKGIYYAINRVGELLMLSSLLPAFDLDQGYVNAEDGDGLRLHSNKRSRNYIALYNKTNHLGALKSNWSLEQKYHFENGNATEMEEVSGSDGQYYGYPKVTTQTQNGVETVQRRESYVNHKHRYIDFYNAYAALKNKADNDETFTKDEVDAVINTYNNFIHKSSEHEHEISTTDPTDLKAYLEEIGSYIREEFAMRNVGTSANMIGIGSSYELSIEGLACQRGEDYETRYYGPVYGVTEMKLLTSVSGMGGGYVYALNHHFDPTVDDSSDGRETGGWCSKWGQDFLQTTGNFVFPGAAYNTADHKEKHNYIVDDCYYDHFDNEHGFYLCDHLHDRDIIRSRATVENVNNSHEVHYWYVSGNTYTYNLTLTAFTSDEPMREFFLNGDDDRVNLFNVKPGTEIKVNEINWFAHNEIPADSCDLSNMDKKYKLYLTMSNNPKNQLVETSEDKNGAYVLRVPRFTYEAGDDQDNPGKIINRLTDIEDENNVPISLYGGKVIDPNYTLNQGITNNFGYDSNGQAITDIKPRLGLRLVDEEQNRYAEMGKEWSTRYFENHLKPDHIVQVVFETTAPPKNNVPSDPIYYILNIEIKYLMGPAVYGNIKIENCALPGEYIYVNADSVEVVMDENLGVAQQKWRLYPNDSAGHRYPNPDYKPDYTPTAYPDLDPEIATSKHLFYQLDTEEFTTEESERVIHIPAYYYQNGWEPAFAIRANGEDFLCSLPFYKRNYDKENKVWFNTDTILPENRLQVHNYHRMRPTYRGDVIDLRLTKGARIYLEDDNDMTYFFQYLDKMQLSDDALKTLTPSAAVPKYQRLTLTDSLGNVTTINPRFCTGLDFYQQKNLAVPTTTVFTQESAKLNFEGNYHGNGNWMVIPSEASIYMVNSGNLYNTGFVSEVATETTIIYNENYGKIYNSFYFNKAGKGALAKNGTLFNCYQNTPLIKHADDPTAVDFKYNELLQLSTLGFRYGQAAYNLNGFYLQKRHKLLHEPYRINDLLQERPNNDPYSLHQRDIDIRGDKDIDYEHYLDNYSVDYIENMFNNGDYRYAFYNLAVGNNVYTQFTEALRTAEEPNYFDRKSNRGTTDPVSMHDYTHKVDEARWCDVHQLYHPLFDQDFMFFGEDLSVDMEHAEEHNYLPEAYHPENRVYRVGGFYGSAADKGYFMNRNAYLDTPLMTAVDFVGYRDKDMYKPDGTLKDDATAYDYNYKHDIEDDGWVIRSGWHEVFMPPTLDLPWTLDADDNPRHDFSKFRVNSDKVTHNLLIYTEDIQEADSVMRQFHYSPDLTYGQTDEYSFATHAETNISAHHIIDDGNGPVMSGEGYFHLVDKHDFNAPVEFKTKRAWYNRQPQDYSDEFIRTNASGEEEVYKDAWEGICLPFDVGKVYAASTDKTNMRDMGEITHFSGDHWKGHEYWLRRLGTASTVEGQLCFERPTAQNLVVSPTLERVGDYTYSNTAFYDLYKDFDYDVPGVPPTINGNDTIWYTHDQLYHYDKNATQKSRTIEDYRYLSRSIPYIVTYPGEYFYEFDLSGKFYARKMREYKNTSLGVVPQTICYLAMEDRDDPDHTTIHITDEVPMISYIQQGYTMKGTFMHVTDNDELSQSVLYSKVNNLAVLDAVDLSGNEVHHGTEFVCHKDNMVVEPFRTYLVGPSSAPSTRSMVTIGSRSVVSHEQIAQEPETEELPETVDAQKEGIKVWVEGQKLVIKTPYDLTTTIFDMSGRPVRHIRAFEGINRYSGLDQGFYIVLRTKFAIL